MFIETVISSLLKENKLSCARNMIKENLSSDKKLFYYYMGLSYCCDRDYNKAVYYFKEARNKGLDNYLINYNLGTAYLEIHEYKAAEEYFLYSINKNRQYENSYINLSYIYCMNNDYKKAYRIIKYGISMNRTSEKLNHIETVLLKNIIGS
jgi:tetratricopeptide (TPR) repeat protein